MSAATLSQILSSKTFRMLLVRNCMLTHGPSRYLISVTERRQASQQEQLWSDSGQFTPIVPKRQGTASTMTKPLFMHLKVKQSVAVPLNMWFVKVCWSKYVKYCKITNIAGRRPELFGNYVLFTEWRHLLASTLRGTECQNTDSLTPCASYPTDTASLSVQPQLSGSLLDDRWGVCEGVCGGNVTWYKKDAEYYRHKETKKQTHWNMQENKTLYSFHKPELYCIKLYSIILF